MSKNTMEKLDISLGGRSYPLTLSPDEVDVVQEAAKAVEAQIAETWWKIMLDMGQLPNRAQSSD